MRIDFQRCLVAMFVIGVAFHLLLLLLLKLTFNGVKLSILTHITLLYFLPFLINLLYLTKAGLWKIRDYFKSFLLIFLAFSVPLFSLQFISLFLCLLLKACM